MVKYSSGTGAGKGYYEFDIPPNANTNYGLDLSFITAANSGRQHVQVWGLDQAYPGFETNIIWATAQANQTDTGVDNGLLASGPLTGTPLYDFIAPQGGGAFVNVHIPAPWGDHLINNKLILVMATLSDPTNNNNGLRLGYQSGSLTYYDITAGTPPFLGAIGDLTAVSTQPSATNNFAVADAEDGPNGLAPFVVSSDETVVPSANVVFGGGGADRTVYVVGGTNTGTAEIIVTVTDNDGNSAERFFRVTVLPLDNPPVISDIAPAYTQLNTAVVVPFTVEDLETAATNLTVTAVVQDYSTNILASLSLSSDPNGTNRSVTVTPANGASGVGVVTVNVSDTSSTTSSVSFAVMVLPSADTVFCDRFDYPLNDKIIDKSAGLWVRRNSSAQSVNLRVSSSSQEAWIRPKSGADDGAARLAGAPYSPGDGAILYTKFKATWTDLGDIPVVGDSSGAFVQLAPNPSATANWRAGVGTMITGVPGGLHRLTIANTSATNFPLTTANLSLETAYNVVVRYDVDTAKSTLWIDATDETGPGVTTADDETPGNANWVNLRQDLNMGNIYVDDLTVVLVQKPILTSITPPSAGSLEIFFTGGVADSISDFGVDGSANVGGAYSPVPAAITALGGGSFKATVSSVSGGMNFYRVRRAPEQF